MLLTVLEQERPVADTLGVARKAGLHLNCNHDAAPMSATECLQSCVGASQGYAQLTPTLLTLEEPS